MNNSPSNEAVHTAMRALFLALGEPDRAALSESEESLPDMRYNYGLHPIFELAETFGPNDVGYTGTSKRGGHLSLPCFDESGDVAIIEIAFHKGDTTVEKLTYPRDPVQVHSALYKLLEQSEVRD